MLKCLTDEQCQQLLDNGSPDNRGKDHIPVVKLFTPDAHATWLLTEIDPENSSHAFGLCDLGLGFPELGYLSLAELSVTRGPLGLQIEQDKYFEPLYPISVYATAARQMQHIDTDNEQLLQSIASNLLPHKKRLGPKPI